MGHPTALLLVTLAAVATSAAPDAIPKTPPWHRKPAGWDLALAAPEEPGPRFVLSGRVIGWDGHPLAGATVYAYHADAHGRSPRWTRPTGPRGTAC